MNAFPKMLMEDDPWSESWQPTPEILAWFRNFLRMMREGATWISPGSQHIYQISHANKTFTLLHGDPHDPKHWHDKNKRTLAALGYRMIDGTEPSDEISFAERGPQQVVAILLDDVAPPFTKQKVTLQYRPYMRDDNWKWFWVLLPEDRSKALATGDADSRAAASMSAHASARKLNVSIGKIDVIKPYSK